MIELALLFGEVRFMWELGWGGKVFVWFEDGRMCRWKEGKVKYDKRVEEVKVKGGIL